MQQRSFSSGSRQAPDPYDQFLEQQGFYRKHTARDASSLFRVISEQIYDTQMHHLAIRKKCVNYMRKHRKFFQILIDRDLDEYLDDMSKPKTFATLIELQAVGLIYERNILLFEPFNLGNYFGYYRTYFFEVFRVFCSPERHFDSVFTSSYIKDAAICQSLCYELLYKDLFKLPDVQYAVEIMLHNGNVEPQQHYDETNEDGYQTHIELYDKRSFTLDLPYNTKCILEDYKMCRFHDSVRAEELNDENEQKALTKPSETLLSNKYISCVRQLLMEGITPFPYKVAKALDPTMYRNIEFDSWNEARKELKLQNWYCGDGNFKVGAKCHVQLPKSDELYTGHIQEISCDRTHCLVFIEQLGEKRLVPYDALSPLPLEQFKPWALPFRFHRHLQKYNSMRLSRQYNCHFKAQQATMQNYCKTFRAAGIGGKGGGQYFHKSCIYNLTHLENFHARTLEYIAMPLTVEHNVNLKYVPDNNNNETVETLETATTATTVEAAEDAPQVTSSNENTVVNVVDDNSPNSREVSLINQNYAFDQSGATYVPEYAYYTTVPSCVGTPEDYYGYGYEPGMHPQFGNGGMYYMCNATGAYSPLANNFYGQAPTMQAPQSVIISPSPLGPPPPTPYFCTTTSPYYASPMPTTAVMPTLLNQATSLSHTIQENGNNSAVGIATPLSGRINYEAKKSFKLNGMDLPSDIPTLRYFYNLGIDSHNRRRYSHDSASREAITVKEERNAGGTKDNISSKPDDNNNIANNAKLNSSNAISSTHQNSSNSKSQYGPPRRFQMRYNNNNPRDHRQPPRRNSDEAGNSGNVYTNSNNSYGQRNYNDYGKNKHQHQNNGGGGNDRHSDSNKSNSTPSTPYNGGNYRMQYSRSYGRNTFYENNGHNVGGGAAGDGAYDTRDANNASENAESGQMYVSYGQPPQHFDHSNDYTNVTTTIVGPTTNSGTANTPGNVLIPFHVQQSPAGAAYGATVYTTATAPAHLLQTLNHATTTANTFGASSNYPTAPTAYFGHPPPSPLMHSAFNAGTALNCGGSLVGPSGFYTSSNPHSSNASESSGGNGCGGANGEFSQPPPPVAGSIPIYVTPNVTTNVTANANGQSIIHQTSLPPPTVPPSMVSGGPQGYWCMPPPANGAPTLMSTPTHLPPPTTSIGFVGPISSSSANNIMPNRKTQQQPHQQQQQPQNDQEKTQ